jgi:hypothetical protein
MSESARLPTYRIAVVTVITGLKESGVTDDSALHQDRGQPRSVFA